MSIRVHLPVQMLACTIPLSFKSVVVLVRVATVRGIYLKV